MDYEKETKVLGTKQLNPYYLSTHCQEGGQDINEAGRRGGKTSLKLKRYEWLFFIVLVRGRSSLYEADRSGGRAIIIAPKRMSRTAFIWFQLLGTLSTNTHPSWGLFQVYCDHILASTWPPPIPILNIIIFKISQTNVHLNFFSWYFSFLMVILKFKSSVTKFHFNPPPPPSKKWLNFIIF